MIMLMGEDKPGAAKWYRKTADQDHAGAQCSLGNYYYDGIGVGEDKPEAAKWYRKTEDQDHAAAQRYLGNYYDTGRVVRTSQRLGSGTRRQQSKAVHRLSMALAFAMSMAGARVKTKLRL